MRSAHLIEKPLTLQEVEQGFLQKGAIVARKLAAVGLNRPIVVRTPKPEETPARLHLGFADKHFVVALAGGRGGHQRRSRRLATLRDRFDGREITAPDNSPIEGAIQTDAAINHGNSGGPLFDLSGKVIGITAQIESNSGGSDGVGFAVPSNLVKSIATQLIADGSVKHPLLGVQVGTLPPTAAKELGEAAGVAVTKVEPGSGAAAAGLKASTGSAIE